MGEKTFLVGIQLERGERGGGGIGGHMSVFSSDPSKCFLPKMGRKLSGKQKHLEWMKMPCTGFHSCHYQCIFLSFLFSSFFPLIFVSVILPSVSFLSPFGQAVLKALTRVFIKNTNTCAFGTVILLEIAFFQT